MSKELVVGTEEFNMVFVDRVIIVSPLEIYFKRKDGKRGRRVCGSLRNDGKRCLADAGKLTDHLGVGYCIAHDRDSRGNANWILFSTAMADGSRLGTMLERTETQEVKINEVFDEIRFQQALIMWALDNIMDKQQYDDNGNPKGDPFTREDIKFLKDLNVDMIRSKEAAARIKGSMKLDALTVRQFIDQLFTFLFSRLSSKFNEAELRKLILDLSDEVFAPMAATSMITGKIPILQKLPDELKNLKEIEVATD